MTSPAHRINNPALPGNCGKALADRLDLILVGDAFGVTRGCVVDDGDACLSGEGEYLIPVSVLGAHRPSVGDIFKADAVIGVEEYQVAALDSIEGTHSPGEAERVAVRCELRPIGGINPEDSRRLDGDDAPAPQPVQYWEPTSGRGSKSQHQLQPRLQDGRVDDSIVTHWLWLRNGTSVFKKARFVRKHS